jgi:hypothetical protein
MRARAAGAAGAWRARGESTLQGCPEPRAKQEEACVTEDGTLFSACPREGAPLRGWQGAQRARGRCPVRGVWAHLQQLLVLLCLCALLLGSQRHRSQLRLGEHHAASSSGQSGGARRAKMRRHRRFLRRTQRRRVRPGILRGSSVSHGSFLLQEGQQLSRLHSGSSPGCETAFYQCECLAKIRRANPHSAGISILRPWWMETLFSPQLIELKT